MFAGESGNGPFCTNWTLTGLRIAIASAVTKQAAKRASFKVNDMVPLPRFGLDAFCNPLVYTFAGAHGRTIMTLSRTLAE
jgi:hypothetical protein